MIVNLIVIVLTLLFGQYYSKVAKNSNKNNSARKSYVKTICFLLILQSGLRNVAVGDDTFNYFLTYEENKTFSWDYIYNSFIEYYKYGMGKDPGYLLFQKIIQIFADNYQIYLFVVAILFFSALGSFIYKNTKTVFDAMLAFIIYSVLFYSFFSITGIRQTIATAAALYAYELIKNKKMIRFLILIFLASTIHKSVLIFIPFYFIAQIKKTKYFYRIILFLFPVFMIYKGSLAALVRSVAGYNEYEDYEGAGTYTFTAMFLLIAVVALFRSKIIMKNNSNAQHYYNAFALALLFLPLSWINPSFLRIIMYFTIFMLIFIPVIIESFNTISVKVKYDIRRVVIILLIALFVKSSWDGRGYAFFWEQMRLPETYYISD
ncbi:EpsG family protein [Flavobacterium lindanitolerans]|uniref:Transmembrane protein EpsG n=1 Tax=Flavobacterium lindanitolerans TaxID=428988 RepID=A0A497U5W1_9FLAO|nr:EpsG family protein [Flavobacterium lindanitolerans]PKW20294.1 transmembrane protein EpsG [Flavobacterium lindanitolerans]RLJ23748.1 transmembrane protein EpsG [Flavobacterium lindanitolerans]